jgi:hypothetical protein
MSSSNVRVVFEYTEFCSDEYQDYKYQLVFDDWKWVYRRQLLSGGKSQILTTTDGCEALSFLHEHFAAAPLEAIFQRTFGEPYFIALYQGVEITFDPTGWELVGSGLSKIKSPQWLLTRDSVWLLAEPSKEQGRIWQRDPFDDVNYEGPLLSSISVTQAADWCVRNKVPTSPELRAESTIPMFDLHQTGLGARAGQRKTVDQGDQMEIRSQAPSEMPHLEKPDDVTPKGIENVFNALQAQQEQRNSQSCSRSDASRPDPMLSPECTSSAQATPQFDDAPPLSTQAGSIQSVDISTTQDALRDLLTEKLPGLVSGAAQTPAAVRLNAVMHRMLDEDERRFDWSHEVWIRELRKQRLPFSKATLQKTRKLSNSALVRIDRLREQNRQGKLVSKETAEIFSEQKRL